jgi:tryptophan-rich sensory protein
MRITRGDVVYFLLPSILVFGSQLLTRGGVRSAGDTVKFRPPAYVFGIAWTLLLLMLGMSWVVASQKTHAKVLCITMYALLTVSLTSWVSVYQRSKAAASWTLIVVLSLALGAAFTSGDVYAQTLLAPLIAWVVFAMIMNTTEVQTADS